MLLWNVPRLAEAMACNQYPDYGRCEANIPAPYSSENPGSRFEEFVLSLFNPNYVNILELWVFYSDLTYSIAASLTL